VAADRQYAAVEANRRVPGDLVDTAVLRFGTGSLTPARVIEVLRRNDVRAVFAGRAFLDEPELMRFLRRGYPHQARFGGALLFTR
jgi:2,4-dienoyl-CoA reductase-like NADH-dependent reductase (Old Yellow Enzyme family)